RRWLAENPLALRDLGVGLETRLISDRAERAARLPGGRDGRVPARGATDPDRARDRLGMLDRRASHEGRCPGGLPADDPRKARLIPAEARPIGGDVPA